jgi:hypothetical protein
VWDDRSLHHDLYNEFMRQYRLFGFFGVRRPGGGQALLNRDAWPGKRGMGISSARRSSPPTMKSGSWWTGSTMRLASS